MALGIGSTPTHTAHTPTLPIPASARVNPGAIGASKATTPTKAVAPATTRSTSTAPGLSTPTTSTPATASTPTTPTTSVPTAGGAVGNPVTQSTSNVHTPAPARSKHSESLSTAAIAAVILAAVLVLACIAWALARRRAFEPHWLLSLRHAMAEAGFRASATWAEFADWARLGH
jgi:hypothetical protein